MDEQRQQEQQEQQQEGEVCRRCEEAVADDGYGYCRECVLECGAEAMDRLEY